MSRSTRFIQAASAAFAAVTLAGCGGGGGGGPMYSGSSSTGSGGGSAYGGGGTMMAAPPAAAGTHYAITNLASNGPVKANYMDAALQNAWGLAFNPGGYAWVTDNGSNKSTLYNGLGVPEAPTVVIPAGLAGAARPTGIVYNASANFLITRAAVSAASQFIFAGEAGTLAGWSPTVNLNSAVTAYDGSAAGSVFKGLAIGASGGANYLYATDFHNGAVDVFNGSFALVTLTGTFADAGIPAGYAPFGIQAVGANLYVTYAQQDAAKHAPVAGASLGLVDVFSTDGVLVKELVLGGVLNAPWGVAMAPADFGPFSNDLLIANFGDGTIHAFNPSTGASLGALTDSSGNALVIDGLWGIAFGNGANDQPSNTLFFAAGPNAGVNGVFGRIDLN